MTYRNRALLDLARGRPCICCGIQDDTVVPAHRNEGKGMGLKASDALHVPLCVSCHSEYDQGDAWSRDEKREWFDALYVEYMGQLFAEGKLEVTGHYRREPKRNPMTSTKVLPRSWPPRAA